MLPPPPCPRLLPAPLGRPEVAFDDPGIVWLRRFLYCSGAVIVGSVDGNRIWGKEIKLQLASVEVGL